MRLHLKLTPNTELVPFNYQYQLTGTLHKWLGENDLHDKISLYSFSWLRGQTERVEGGLNFPKGARWFISFWENKHGPDLIQGIVDQPNVIYGMKVSELQVAPVPDFKDEYRFKAASPVLIRKNINGDRRQHLTFADEDAGQFMLRTFKSKLKEADLKVDEEKLEIQFDKNYSRPKTKLITVKETELKANLCPIIMKGDPKAIEFAWNVGIGELTGSGFGAVC